MSKRWLFGLMAAALACGSGVLSGSALSGAPPTTVTCGMTVTTSIVVANDLTDCPADGLLVGADKITINLNGHTIDGNEDATCCLENGVGNKGGFDGVKIMNGTITDFGNGVLVNVGSEMNVVSGIEARSNSSGFWVSGTTATLSKNRLIGNASFGIELFSGGHTVSGNYVVANTGTGINDPNGGSRITGNTISAGGARGISTASLSVVSGNTVTRSTSDGIFVFGGTGVIVTKNRVLGNLGNGIVVTSSDGAIVTRNEVTGNALNGIRFESSSQDAQVQGNTVMGNSSNGISSADAGGGMTVGKNVATANGGIGITLVAGIDGKGNKAIANAAGGCVIVACSS